jgi:CBS domain-containing protein
MSAGRICSRTVHIIDADDSVEHAARLMRDERTGTLILVDEKRKPMGIVTDRDLAMRVLPEAKDPKVTRMREVMTVAPKVASEDLPIEEAVRLMQSGGFRRLPVVDRAGRLVGILSLDDVLSLISEEFVSVGKLLARERPWAQT